MSPAHPSSAVHPAKARLEALSDGVFSIALTLLIIDVVSSGKAVEAGEHLSAHLFREWPSLVAYLVGFMTILVCWINHHRVYHYVRRTDSGLLWIIGLQLALVSAVPLPTSVLAANFTGEGSRAALLLYGVTFWLMATSFWVLWRYVDRRGLTDASIDPDRYHGMERIYGYAVAWTLLCLYIASVSVYPAFVMWALMFVVFAFPGEFAHFMRRRDRD